MKKQSKLLIIIVGGILLAATIAITAVLMVSGSDGRKYQKHMEAAQKYLDELQYEQAIAEYELAIEIEPNNIEAYQALAELYVQMEDYDSAVAVLNRGIEQTESEKIANYLEEVQRTLEEKQAQITVQESEAENSPGEVRAYWRDRDVKGYITYEYDEHGNLIKGTWYYDDGAIYGYSAYENGNLVKMTHNNSDGTIDYILEYDESGNQVKESNYNADGTLNSYTIHEYDKNGNLVKGSDYRADGKLIGYSIHEYDENGNWVKNSVYDADGALHSEW